MEIDWIKEEAKALKDALAEINDDPVGRGQAFAFVKKIVAADPHPLVHVEVLDIPLAEVKKAIEEKMEVPKSVFAPVERVHIANLLDEAEQSTSQWPILLVKKDGILDLKFTDYGTFTFWLLQVWISGTLDFSGLKAVSAGGGGP